MVIIDFDKDTIKSTHFVSKKIKKKTQCVEENDFTETLL